MGKTKIKNDKLKTKNGDGSRFIRNLSPFLIQVSSYCRDENGLWFILKYAKEPSPGIFRVMEIRDGQMIDYPGNYSYFVEKRAQLLSLDGNSSIAMKNVQPSKPKIKTLDKLKKQEEAKERNRLYQQNKDALDRLKSTEGEIKVLEKNKINAENQLCDPLVLKDSSKVRNLMIDLKKYKQELATLTKTRKELTKSLPKDIPSTN